MKPCIRCVVTKPLDRFPRDPRQKDGHRNVCKDCSREDPAKNRARVKAWAKANPEKANALARKWVKANPERRRQIARECARRRYVVHREKLRAESRVRMRDSYRKDPQRRQQSSKRARRKLIARDPEAYRLTRRVEAAVRRSRKRGAIVGIVDYARIRVRDKMRCHLCRLKVKPKQLEFDHVIPLAAGGEHSEANIAVSHARCNRSKNAKRLTLF